MIQGIILDKKNKNKKEGYSLAWFLFLLNILKSNLYVFNLIHHVAHLTLPLTKTMLKPLNKKISVMFKINDYQWLWCDKELDLYHVGSYDSAYNLTQKHTTTTIQTSTYVNRSYNALK